MTQYFYRDIATMGAPHVPSDFLQSLVICELLRPSRRLWIASAWVSDIELVDNRARQFSSFCPDWPAAKIRLSTVLTTLLERGTDIVLVMNDSLHNDEIAGRMQALRLLHGDRVRVIRATNLHEKGIVGDRFSLAGSMNLTYNGVYVNEEHLTYTCDPARVAERRNALDTRWSASL